MGTASRSRPRVRASPGHLRYYGLAGLLSFALPYAVLFLAVPHLGAGLASALFALPPLFTYVFALALGQEQAEGRGALGLAGGLAGSLLIAASRGALGGPTSWLLLALLAPVSLALGNLYRKSAWPTDSSPLALAAGTLLASAVLLAGPALQAGGLLTPWVEAPGAISGQVVLTSGANVLFFALQRRSRPLVFSQVGLVITTSGLVLGWLVLGERHSATVWGGAVLLLASVVLVQLHRPVAPAPANPIEPPHITSTS